MHPDPLDAITGTAPLVYGHMPKHHDYRFLAEIGRRLASKREDLELSQQDVASKSKITAQQLSAYEHGLSDPPLSTLIRITRALQMNPTSLLIQSMILSETDKRP
jgi:transcriptional regulator with XRE-family HTH domain